MSNNQDREEWLYQNDVYEVFDLRKQLQEAQQAREAKQEQVEIVMRHKNQWMDRALAAEARIVDILTAAGCHEDGGPQTHEQFCDWLRTLEAQCATQAAQLQFIVNWIDHKGLLEEHVFTFPDGDVWESTNVKTK